VTRTGAEEQLRALAGVAVWNLAAPAVIRPHRDGWLIFMRAQYAWYGTPRRRRTHCPPGTTATASASDCAALIPYGGSFVKWSA